MNLRSRKIEIIGNNNFERWSNGNDCRWDSNLDWYRVVCYILLVLACFQGKDRRKEPWGISVCYGCRSSNDYEPMGIWSGKAGRRRASHEGHSSRSTGCRLDILLRKNSLSITRFEAWPNPFPCQYLSRQLFSFWEWPQASSRQLLRLYSWWRSLTWCPWNARIRSTWW